MNIHTIFSSLKKSRCCSNAYDFSENYLGRTKSYYSVLKARNLEPSLEAVLNLEYKLEELRTDLENDDEESLRNAATRLAIVSEQVAHYKQERCKKNIRRHNRRLS